MPLPRIPGLRRRFHAPELTDVGARVDDELAFHFQMRIEELVARGMSPDAARAEAERKFGAYEEARRRLHESAMRREG